MDYKSIEISIFRNYEGKYGTEQEHLNTIKGDEVDIFEGGGDVDIEDILDAVRETLECKHTIDQLSKGRK